MKVVVAKKAARKQLLQGKTKAQQTSESTGSVSAVYKGPVEMYAKGLEHRQRKAEKLEALRKGRLDAEEAHCRPSIYTASADMADPRSNLGQIACWKYLQSQNAGGL